ncbi:hypothetical protein [Pseudomonas orientalis]|uniref:hypothetical protein n=1 Tax=Pseudomonas orientalis TaxID=76758 RepID=UPI0030DAE609
MLLIRQREATAQILDTEMRQWVEIQFRDLQTYGTQWQPDELGWFAVWGEGDDPYDKGLFLGVRSLLKSPCDPEPSFEIVEDHGHFYTAVILLSDLLSVEVLIQKGLSLPSEMSTRLAQWSPQ